MLWASEGAPELVIIATGSEVQLAVDAAKKLGYTGYAGTELGDWGFMPTDPDELRSVYHDPEYAEIRDELKRKLWQAQAAVGDNPPTLERIGDLPLLG